MLQDASAVLVDLPYRGLRSAALHGGVEFDLLVWQAVAKEDVWHVLDSRIWNARLWRGRQV